MSDDPLAAIKAALARLEAGQTALRTDLMARMDRLQNSLTEMARDFQNTKGFLIEDSLVLGRRVSGAESRLDDLEKKP